jgi:hypothetical protein
MVGSALWGDRSSRHIDILVSISAVAALIFTKTISSYWTVRAFARAEHPGSSGLGVTAISGMQAARTTS